MVRSNAPTVSLQPGKTATGHPSRWLVLLLALTCLLSSTGCRRLYGRVYLKRANMLYRQGKYEKAIDTYAKIPRGVPDRVQAALNTAYSWMAQYRFGSRAEKDRAIADQAVKAYEEYLKVLPSDNKKDFLPDKEMIDEYIITLLIDSGRFDDAVSRLNDKLKVTPDEPKLLRGLASTYEKWNRPAMALKYFDQWAALFPKDANPHTAIAAFCWNLSYRHGASLDPQLRNRWVDHGIQQGELALQIEPESADGLVYTNLLLRERAKLRTDPDEVAALLKRANDMLEKAKAIKQKQKERDEALIREASKQKKTS